MFSNLAEDEELLRNIFQNAQKSSSFISLAVSLYNRNVKLLLDFGVFLISMKIVIFIPLTINIHYHFYQRSKMFRNFQLKCTAWKCHCVSKLINFYRGHHRKPGSDYLQGEAKKCNPIHWASCQPICQAPTRSLARPGALQIPGKSAGLRVKDGNAASTDRQCSAVAHQSILHTSPILYLRPRLAAACFSSVRPHAKWLREEQRRRTSPGSYFTNARYRNKGKKRRSVSIGHNRNGYPFSIFVSVKDNGERAPSWAAWIPPTTWSACLLTADF